MKYTNSNQQRMARQLAEAVGKVDSASKGADPPMYDSFATSMNRYVDGVLRPFLDSSILIEITEARHEWCKRKNREEVDARYSRQRRLKRVIYSDIGDGIPINVDSVGQRAGKQITGKDQTTASSTDPPTLEEYWGFMCNTERTGAREELEFLKSSDPEAYEACMEAYTSRITENDSLVSGFLKVFGRHYCNTSSPINHLKPPAEKSPKLMEYWNMLERKKEAYKQAHASVKAVLDNSIYGALFSAATRINGGIGIEERRELEENKREFTRIGQEDGLGEFVACLAPSRLIGVEVADNQDVIDKLIIDLEAQPTRAIAAPQDSDLKREEADGSKRVIEG